MAKILFKHLRLKLLKSGLCNIGEAIASTATNRVRRDHGLNTVGGFKIKRDIPIYTIKEANIGFNLGGRFRNRSIDTNTTIKKKTGVGI